jgi:hypothetical protein
VSDRLTLRGMGVARRVADVANQRMAASYDTVVGITAFALTTAGHVR